MAKIDFKKAISAPPARDLANFAIQGRVVSKTISLPLFTLNRNAVWAAEEGLKDLSYPAARLSFPSNRTLFKYEPGDRFILNYAPYGISNMVCRVLRIVEADLLDESITVYAIQESTGSIGAVQEGSDPVDHRVARPDYTVDPLIYTALAEPPFALAGESLGVACLVPRRNQKETGFTVYISQDGGVSYDPVANRAGFSFYGLTTAVYPETIRIDDATGFEVDFVNNDIEAVQTTSRGNLFSYLHLAQLGSELISFQTITPVVGFDFRYKFENVNRGLFDTAPAEHAAGEAFYYLGQAVNPVAHESILPGAVRYFKLVGYNAVQSGVLADATAANLTISGRGFIPYRPGGFQCNGGGSKGTYSTTCVLTWTPRIRAGLNVCSDAVIGGAQTWEGLFEIEMWEGAVRTGHEDDLDAATKTLTPTLGGTAVFKLRNKIVTAGAVYASAWAEITVKKV